MGALFVTHSVDEALLLGDEILIMENGKVGSRFDDWERNLAYPRDLLSEEMIGIKRKIIKTLENSLNVKQNCGSAKRIAIRYRGVKIFKT